MGKHHTVRYKAFISYSHKDSQFAKWLHKNLENWKVPKDLVGRETQVGKIPRNLRPVFRDRDDFAGGHSLKDATYQALFESEFMIVICSPHSAQSIYVNEEIKQFKLMGKAHRIIPLILAGEPGDEHDECFPPSVKYQLDDKGDLTDELAEPIAPDAREQGDGRSRAMAKVVAGIIGVTFDDIVKREEAARKRRLAIYSGLGTGAFIFATVLSAYALYQSYLSNLTIEKSLFTISSLVQETDQLSQDDNLEETRSEMLRTQCDLQDGLAKNNQSINILSQSICLMEKANALIKLKDIQKANQLLRNYQNGLKNTYRQQLKLNQIAPDTANAYVKVIYFIYLKSEELKRDKLKIFNQLMTISYKVGMQSPELLYPFHIHDWAVWEKLEQFGQLEELSNQRELELEQLLKNSITVREEQAKAYQFFDTNIVMLSLVKLRELLAVIQHNVLLKSTEAMESIDKAEKELTSIIRQLDNVEDLLDAGRYYLTFAEIYEANKQMDKAMPLYHKSEEVLKDLKNNYPLSKPEQKNLEEYLLRLEDALR